MDGAIVDAFDTQTLNVYNVIKNQNPKNPTDELYIELYNTMQNFGELEDIKYNKNDIEQHRIYRSATILLNKEIYSHSFV